MPADERFTIRAYRSGDEEAILDLFARSFHVSRSKEHFDWKYRNDPYGNEHISLAWEGDRLVAHYAGYPVPFWYERSAVIAHQIGDTMTDPAVRHVGRGPSSILGRTSKHFYDTFCEGKVAFNYGFNVGNIHRFSALFLRMQLFEPVRYRVRDNLTATSRLRRWLGGYEMTAVRETGSEYDDFFARVAPTYRFLVRRDAEYIRWRYLQFAEPGYFVVAIRKRGVLVGWSAFRVREDSLLWGDALFEPRHADAVEILIRHVASSSPARRIEAWFPDRPQWFDATLSRLGFVTAPQPQGLAAVCVPFALPAPIEILRESLYYTMGDSDLF